MDNLTKFIKAIPVEEFTTYIQNEEKLIFEKYNMKGNPFASVNTRSVTIPYSSVSLSDNHLREYLIDENLVALIYDRRNDFNSIDLYVVDFEGINKINI